MENRLNFTKAALDKLPLPEAGKRAVYYDEGGSSSVPGLQLRVTSSGVKTFSVFKRVAGGEPERATLGRYPDLTIEEARKKALDARAQFAQGKSLAAAKRVKRVKSLTLAQAVEEYVTKKRRTEKELPLKPRTVADYRRMVSPGRPKASGGQTLDGELFTLADTVITDITAEQVKKLHSDILKERGERRATYAIVVLRAVLKGHKVVIPGDLFSKDAGLDRIGLPPSGGEPEPIPDDFLGAWWNAACRAGVDIGGSRLAGDYYRFQLLTGCRGVEILGDKYGNEPIRVKDVNLANASIKLVNTKNRLDHTLLLSRQAQEIVKRNTEGKEPDDLLFPVGDPRKTLHAINKAVGLPPLACRGHALRATFATIAEDLVSAYTLKALLNHKIKRTGDTTARYIKKEEEKKRAGWQAVADYIEAKAAMAKAGNVTPLPEAAA